MKRRIIALMLVLCMMFGIGGFSAFAGTPIFDVTDHWKKNVVIFYNVDDIFNAATICYCADGSENWQSAEMSYGGKNEYHQDSWYFTMPEGKYRYYITDGTHRTQEQYFTNEVLLYLMNETDGNGYYKLYVDSIALKPEGSSSVYDKLVEHLSELTHGYDTQLYAYEELYTHYDKDGKADWVFVNAFGGGGMPWIACKIFNHRVYLLDTTSGLFEFGMGLYDVKEDVFIDIARMDDYSAYDGLAEAIDTYGKGVLLGDIDRDDAMTVLDATMLQRCSAKIAEYPANDEIEPYSSSYTHIRYYSDFNLDGERSILDATCMQRYLARV